MAVTVPSFGPHMIRRSVRPCLSSKTTRMHHFVMSAIGPKQTSASALHMSAFGGKADMTQGLMFAFAVAIGGKADMPFCTAYVG